MWDNRYSVFLDLALDMHTSQPSFCTFHCSHDPVFWTNNEICSQKSVMFVQHIFVLIETVRIGQFGNAFACHFLSIFVLRRNLVVANGFVTFRAQSELEIYYCTRMKFLLTQ